VSVAQPLDERLQVFEPVHALATGWQAEGRQDASLVPIPQGGNRYVQQFGGLSNLHQLLGLKQFHKGSLFQQSGIILGIAYYYIVGINSSY
jgi:hypothetical protein